MGKNINLENIKELKNYPVVKSNKLVEAKYKLTLNEVRLVYTVISLIKSEDEDFKLYRIQVKDLIEMFEIKTNDYHKQIRKILLNLASKPILIKRDKDKNITGDKDRYLVANWFGTSEYIGDGIIEIEISPKMKPYLLQLKDNFTIGYN